VELASLLGELTRRLRFSAFFSTAVSVDPRDTTTRIVHLTEPETLISKAYLLELNVLEQYRDLISSVLRVFKGSDENVVNSVIHMEIQLVMAMELKWKLKRKDVVKLSLSRLPCSKKWNWVVFIRTILGDIIDVSNATEVIVRRPKFFTRLAAIFDNTTRKTIVDYVGWRLLVAFSPFLPDAFRPLTSLTLRGSVNLFASPPRWYSCYEAVTRVMQYAVSAAYAHRYLKGKARAIRRDVRQKYALISERVFEAIQRSSWIHVKTRRIIHQRMTSITLYLLYPSFVENEFAISAFYHIVPDVTMDHVLESYHKTLSALSEHYWQWLVEDWIGPEY
ncbi:unnamed protein product, partial [Ixodes persulcatus]